MAIESTSSLVGSHNPNDRIDFKAFEPIYAAMLKLPPVPTDEFLAGLRQFDREGTGFVPFDEVKHLLTAIGERITDKEAEELMIGMKDPKGNIDYVNFVKVLAG